MSDNGLEILEVCKSIDKLTEELKRIADFLIATKSIPERESTKKMEDLPVVKDEITTDIFRITQKAVGIKWESQGLIAWIPKKAIENLDKIVIEEGKRVTLKLASWFTLEWKEDKF
jgi:hypothetical protein